VLRFSEVSSALDRWKAELWELGSEERLSPEDKAYYLTLSGYFRCRTAAYNGNLNALKWLFRDSLRNTIDFHRIVISAIQGDRLRILEYLDQKGFIPVKSGFYCYKAINLRRFEIFKWFIARGDFRNDKPTLLFYCKSHERNDNTISSWIERSL